MTPPGRHRPVDAATLRRIIERVEATDDWPKPRHVADIPVTPEGKREPSTRFRMACTVVMAVGLTLLLGLFIWWAILRPVFG